MIEIKCRISGVVLFSADVATVAAALAAAIEANADLQSADLRSADLRSADLRSADLRSADLRSADLRSANLRSADLQFADLQFADLQSADLQFANLRSADLQFANNAALIVAQTSITPDGTLLAWKKLNGGCLAKLRIPEAARRSNATGRKCRAEFAEVLEIIGGAEGVSEYDSKTLYRAGLTVRCHEWCDDRWQECAGGIHFYLTRAEAEAH